MASPPQPCFPAPGLAWADAQRWLSGSRVGCPAAAPLLHFPLAGTPPTSALLRLAWLTFSSSAPPALTRSLSPFTPHPPMRTCIHSILKPVVHPDPGSQCQYPGSGPLPGRYLEKEVSGPAVNWIPGLRPVVFRHPGVSDSLTWLPLAASRRPQEATDCSQLSFTQKNLGFSHPSLE